MFCTINIWSSPSSRQFSVNYLENEGVGDIGSEMKATNEDYSSQMQMNLAVLDIRVTT